MQARRPEPSQRLWARRQRRRVRLRARRRRRPSGSTPRQVRDKNGGGEGVVAEALVAEAVGSPPLTETGESGARSIVGDVAVLPVSCIVGPSLPLPVTRVGHRMAQ